MIRKSIILMLVIAASASVALTAISFRLSDVNQGYEFYGWWPAGINISKKCMLFRHAERGELTVIGHHYILPKRAVSQISLDWWVVTYRRDTVILPPETVEQERILGREATSQRLSWKVTVQLWLLVVLFGTYPVTVYIRGPLRRYRRRKRGLCLKCGYNLTGNTTGICSECGTAFDPKIFRLFGK